MRETLLFLTHRYTYLCTPAWEYGGVSHCQLLSWIHTESKTTTHVHYTCVQMWLKQELHILVHACPCRYVPSVHVGRRCVTSELLKSSICL